MHILKQKTLKSFILSSCAILTLTACSQNFEKTFSSYKGSNEAYMADKQTYEDTFKTTDVKEDSDSNKAFVRTEPSKPQANPAYTIEVEDEKPMGQESTLSEHQTNMFSENEEPTKTDNMMMEATSEDVMMMSNSPYAKSVSGCPTLEIYSNMESISYFKGGDRTKLIADASISDLRGVCVERGNTLDIDLKMLVDARIGAHGRYQTDTDAEELQSYPYYLALVNKKTEAVEYKKIFASIIKFPLNQNVQSKYEDIFVTVPMPTGQTKDGYILNIGFQLTDEQLAYNEGTVLPSRTQNAEPVQMQQNMAQEQPEPIMYSQENHLKNEPNNTKTVQTPVEITPKTTPQSTLRKSGFLNNRPRVSVDPLEDAYSGTFVEE